MNGLNIFSWRDEYWEYMQFEHSVGQSSSFYLQDGCKYRFVVRLHSCETCMCFWKAQIQISSIACNFAQGLAWRIVLKLQGVVLSLFSVHGPNSLLSYIKAFRIESCKSLSLVSSLSRHTWHFFILSPLRHLSEANKEEGWPPRWSKIGTTGVVDASSSKP